MGKKQWQYRWYNWISPTRLPGVWRRQKGGHLVRARVTCAATSRLKEIRKVLPNHSEAEAFAWLEAEKEKVRVGLDLQTRQKTHFGDFAVSLLEKKATMGELSTWSSQERWRDTLEHLIAGTKSDDGALAVAGFGSLLVDQIRASHVEAWKVGIAGLVRAGHYSPNTANSWFAVLRIVLKAAKREFGLPSAATDGVKGFDTREHATYTVEAPNSLAAHEVPLFLQKVKEDHPQHYAMTYLGFATGLRPSSMRPLRRRGETPDIQWDGKRLLVRRSQTLGKKVRENTKQGFRYAIQLPDDIIEVLRWHVETQLVTQGQCDSDLLFPSLDGDFRSGSVLNKPFEEVSEAMGLGYKFTARGMRRTFNDLARVADVPDLITRSISGHATEQMQRHYSTVRGDEQREGLAKVVSLMKAREQHHSDSKTGADSIPVDESGGTASGTSPEASGTEPQAGQGSSQSGASGVGAPRAAAAGAKRRGPK